MAERGPRAVEGDKESLVTCLGVDLEATGSQIEDILEREVEILVNAIGGYRSAGTGQPRVGCDYEAPLTLVGVLAIDVRLRKRCQQKCEHQEAGSEFYVASLHHA